MKYFVSLQDNAPAREVEIAELPAGGLAVKLDGREIAVDLVAIGQALNIRIEGRVVDLTTEGVPPELGVIAGGHRSYVRVESERERAAAAASSADRGATAKLLKSPMPGRIVKVCVEPGATVASGDPLMVVEAMKMENELRAKAPGIVAEVFVKTGDTVDRNARLLSFR